ncbi:hypothetical protein CLV24_11585 [Pontibacter ummariensis]|uniref:Uncharacterized protein n=1 Tax=Pontibacter ummariensis TaxID=1610492 RepID=A0A239I103_9BACT|nr:hypothetical protein [Pontibacter ummariensis]PRY10168.1 hypothetical protein CLV24_11585 [Pontibacter ummariensis]SNS87320.1 hypothetical protein SAMN06296052_11585 [Pontibacter ummariensis]
MEENTRDNVDIKAWSKKGGAPTPKDFAHIKGWGADIDPENDPTYPMRNREKEDHGGYDWERPPLQPVNMEVLHSLERPNITAVFGTAMPPHGLSGQIRRFAFRYSEASYIHWLSLIMADRVNVVEGVIDDLKRGQVPNIYAEKGYKALWKHDRTGLFKKLAVGALVTTAAVALIARKAKD